MTSYDTARIVHGVQHREADALPDDSFTNGNERKPPTPGSMPLEMGHARPKDEAGPGVVWPFPSLEAPGIPSGRYESDSQQRMQPHDQPMLAIWGSTARSSDSSLPTAGFASPMRSGNPYPTTQQPQRPGPTALQPEMAIAAMVNSAILSLEAQLASKHGTAAIGTAASTLSPSVLTVHAASALPAANSAASSAASIAANMFVISAPPPAQLATPLVLSTNQLVPADARHSVQSTASAVMQTPAHASISTASSLAQYTPSASVASTDADTGHSETSSVRDGGALRTPSYKLSDGYVVLIIIAVLFVAAIMFYYYIRRRKRPANNAGSTNGRSILSSHSGVPSVGADEEDKYFAAGPRYARNMPDSGTSVNYLSKIASTSASKRLIGAHGGLADGQGHQLQAVSTLPGRFAQLQIPGIGEQHGASSWEPNASYCNFRTHDAAERTSNEPSDHSGMATAKSDIYDCIQAGKDASRLMPAPHSFMSSYVAEPAQAALKRGSLSLDQVNIRRQQQQQQQQQQQEAAAADGKNSPEALNGVSAALGAFVGIGTASHSAEMQVPEFPMPPTSIDVKRSLLDTTSANPSIIKQATEDGASSVKIKPRKLVRAMSQQPSKSGPGTTAGRRIGSPKKVMSSTGLQQPQVQGLLLERDSGKTTGEALYGGPAPALPVFIPEPSIMLPPAALGTFLSLLDSTESLSDNYQFAVRHDPLLGPLPAVEPHIPSLPDELRVRRGDEICVVGEFADGWVMAVNASRGNEYGMIPRRCLFFPTAPFMSERSLMETAFSPAASQPSPHPLAPSSQR